MCICKPMLSRQASLQKKRVRPLSSPLGLPTVIAWSNCKMFAQSHKRTRHLGIEHDKTPKQVTNNKTSQIQALDARCIGGATMAASFSSRTSLQPQPWIATLREKTPSTRSFHRRRELRLLRFTTVILALATLCMAGLSGKPWIK